MGVALHLGLESDESPLLAAARTGWRRWCVDDPTLAVVSQLDDLPDWTRQADDAEKDAVLGRVAELAVHNGNAAVVLAWLLLPGATRCAAELNDLHPDIEGLVAGQLWIEVSAAHTSRCSRANRRHAPPAR